VKEPHKHSPLAETPSSILQLDKGRLVVVSGPSGVGKGTVCKALLAAHPEFHLSVSATTRSPRTGEVEGQHYHFLTHAQFEARIAEGAFLEYATYNGQHYGTLAEPTLAALAAGKVVVLEIDPQGARQVKANFPQAMTVFLRPPSMAVLHERLLTRGTETPEAIAKRLAIAEQELAEASDFDVQLVNATIPATVTELISFLNPVTDMPLE
jgi:guanylate kinase